MLLSSLGVYCGYLSSATKRADTLFRQNIRNTWFMVSLLPTYVQKFCPMTSHTFPEAPAGAQAVGSMVDLSYFGNAQSTYCRIYGVS